MKLYSINIPDGDDYSIVSDWLLLEYSSIKIDDHFLSDGKPKDDK